MYSPRSLKNYFKIVLSHQLNQRVKRLKVPSLPPKDDQSFAFLQEKGLAMPSQSSPMVNRRTFMYQLQYLNREIAYQKIKYDVQCQGFFFVPLLFVLLEVVFDLDFFVLPLILFFGDFSLYMRTIQ